MTLSGSRTASSSSSLFMVCTSQMWRQFYFGKEEEEEEEEEEGFPKSAQTPFSLPTLASQVSISCLPAANAAA